MIKHVKPRATFIRKAFVTCCRNSLTTLQKTIKQPCAIHLKPMFPSNKIGVSQLTGFDMTEKLTKKKLRKRRIWANYFGEVLYMKKKLNECCHE